MRIVRRPAGLKTLKRRRRRRRRFATATLHRCVVLRGVRKVFARTPTYSASDTSTQAKRTCAPAYLPMPNARFKHKQFRLRLESYNTTRTCRHVSPTHRRASARALLCMFREVEEKVEGNMWQTGVCVPI